MAIRTQRTEIQSDIPTEPMIFPDHKIAHKYCQGIGVEIGAAAHNPFNLAGAINVAPYSDNPDDPDYNDFIIYKQHQIDYCGCYAIIDLVGEANNIPLPDNSQDYIVSSHVVEHLPNLIDAFLEWNRILKQGGIILMIFPKRDSHNLDVTRNITSLQHFVNDFIVGCDVNSHPIPEGGHGWRGHYHVFTLQSMIDLIKWCNQYLNLNWQIEYTEETDSKVGNGHTIIARLHRKHLVQDRQALRHYIASLPNPFS